MEARCVRRSPVNPPIHFSGRAGGERRACVKGVLCNGGEEGMDAAANKGRREFSVVLRGRERVFGVHCATIPRPMGRNGGPPESSISLFSFLSRIFQSFLLASLYCALLTSRDTVFNE